MPDVTKRLRELVGEEEDSGLGIAEIDKNTVRLWADAFGDRNPLYMDEQYACQSEEGGIIAPPIMAATYCWMHRRTIAEPSAIGGGFRLGRRIVEVGQFTNVIAQKYEWDFLVPLRLGDRVRCTLRVIDVSEQKQSRLGPGHFITRECEFTNQRGEIVVRSRTTAFGYWTESGRASEGQI